MLELNMSPANRSTAPDWPKAAALLVVALAVTAFLWLNLNTAMSVAPWSDEAMQVDAGVNLYLGNGWVSTAWPSQSVSEFWAANNPLYTLLVYVWIRIFGFSPVVVRSLNYLLVLGLAWLVADTAKRSGMIASRWARILLGMLVVCDAAVTYVYRNGRADFVPMLVAALLFRIYTCVPDPRRRRGLLFLASTLMLASGLHIIPYIVLLLCVDYLVSRKLRIPDLAAIGLGCAAGGLALAAFFLARHSLRAYIVQTFASGYNILGSAAQAVLNHDRVTVSRFLVQVKALSPFHVLLVIGQDFSLLPPLLCLLCLAILLWRAPAHRIGDDSRLRVAARAGLIAAVLIPYGMLAAGRYAFYYAGMGAIPVLIAFTVVLEQFWLARQQAWIKAGVLAALLSIALGMPATVWRDVRKTPPQSYRLVEQFVRSETMPGDEIYGDPVLYYAAKTARIPFFTTSYGGGHGYSRIADEERSRMSVVIVRPDQLDAVFEKLGPGWIPQPPHSLPYGFSLVVCKRAALR